MRLRICLLNLRGCNETDTRPPTDEPAPDESRLTPQRTFC
jgi:hypothetical protein